VAGLAAAAAAAFRVEERAVAGKAVFNPSEEEAIKNAVASAEASSAVEIVPYISNRCDSYPAVFWRMAIFFSFLIGFALVFLHPNMDPLWILCLQGLGLPTAFLLQYSNFFSRLFLDDYDSQAEVHERAVQTFHELGVHRTSSRTGVLIFVALFEHRVEIVCDIAIEEKISRDQWQKITQALALGIRQGNLAKALAEAVAAIGELARPLFPATANDKNELSDELVRK
jgi:putative membrane protein